MLYLGASALFILGLKGLSSPKSARRGMNYAAIGMLLAEAMVPYDLLCEMDQINDDFPNTDVALIVGANDVVNPAARHKKDSPLYGMPILEADKARSVIVLKRSLKPGFAGEDNELFYDPKTMMVFGDAKVTLTKIVQLLKK